MTAAVCPFRFCGGLVEQRMDRLGRVGDFCARCDRRQRGICRDCSAPVEGMIGRAIRCAVHKQTARRASERRSMRDDQLRRRKNAATRTRSKRPDVRARKLANRRAWAKAHPAHVKRHRRRYLLKQTPKYLATQRRHNRNPTRVQKKREWAIAKYNELHPVRPDPHCSGCQAPIVWDGCGRPRLTCDRCCTPAELRRRSRARAA